MTRIMLAGGGTGGHVFPLIAVAQEILRQAKAIEADVSIRFIGSGQLIRKEADMIGLESCTVTAPKWRSYSRLRSVIEFWKLPLAIAQSFWHMLSFMPDVVLSKGGYGAFFPTLMARIFSIPIYIHESDTIPGKSNRWLSRFAKTIYTSFDMTSKYVPLSRVRMVGTPLRPQSLHLVDKIDAIRAFGLTDEKPIIFFTGGSQGAKIINDALMIGLIEFVKKYHIIHQCGQVHYKELSDLLEKIVKEEPQNKEIIVNSYRLYPILTAQQMSLAYSASDVVVSRAGSEIHQIAVLGKPAVLIPIAASANNHQYYNAKEAAKYGAVFLDETNLKSHLLSYEIDQVYENRYDIANKLRQFAQPHAAEIIARDMLHV